MDMLSTQLSNFGLVETSPPLPGRLLGHGLNKTASTHDLVEQMHYLFVNVVKAKHLLSGLSPYVEVKLDNYRGITGHSYKNRNPVWQQIFAFSKEGMHSNLLEVVVKNKHVGKDDYVGRVSFELSELSLAPQWYELENKTGEKVQGKIMLAVWKGTQGDEAYHNGLHPGTLNISQEGIVHMRSQIYYSPKLYYLRLHIIQAQDLVSSHKGRVPHAAVKVQLGDQVQYTRADRSVNPVWNEELMFVVSKPFNDFLVFLVEDRLGSNMFPSLGQKILPMCVATKRLDHCNPVEAQWFNLEKPSFTSNGYEKEVKFESKIHMRLCLEAGYHVLTESIHCTSSDLQLPSKHFRNPSIGILELGVLSARNLIPLQARDGRCSDAYCVAKYGSKWVRTRTVLDTCSPRWNEQYTWDVYDPYTVITIAVFNNCHLFGENENGTIKDQLMGKVRIRLSRLETNRIYTHFYPLFLLQPSGLKKMGELHLALRFKCDAWMNMVSLYSKPLLPNMHYLQPIADDYIDFLRYQAVIAVAARLASAEPPLQKEVVEYMLEIDPIWSLRQCKANILRLSSLVFTVGRLFDDVQNWRKPVIACLAHVLFLTQVCYPKLILPMLFLKLFLIGVWNYWFRPWNSPHIDTRLPHPENTHPDELDEESDTFPTSSCPEIYMRMRYDRLRSQAFQIDKVAAYLAAQAERAHAILSWHDPRATAILLVLLLVTMVFLYAMSLQVVCALIGLYLLRHPRLRSRSKMPSMAMNFYQRLPTKSDVLIGVLDTYSWPRGYGGFIPLEPDNLCLFYM